MQGAECFPGKGAPAVAPAGPASMRPGWACKTQVYKDAGGGHARCQDCLLLCDLYPVTALSWGASFLT